MHELQSKTKEILLRHHEPDLEPRAQRELITSLKFRGLARLFFCLCLAIHAALSLPPFPDCLLIQFDKGEARFEVGKGERRGSALKHRRR